MLSFDYLSNQVKICGKISGKAKISIREQEMIKFIEKKNALFTFKLVVNKLKYNLSNKFYLPMEIWQLIDKDLTNDLMIQYNQYNNSVNEKNYNYDYGPCFRDYYSGSFSGCMSLIAYGSDKPLREKIFKRTRADLHKQSKYQKTRSYQNGKR